MEQFFLGIDSYFLHAYSLLLMAGIFVYKQLNSHTISATVMVLFEVFFGFIEDPLFDFILTLGTHSGRITWYLSWILFWLVSIYLLDSFHQKLSIYKTPITNLIRRSFFFMIVIYIIDCFDRYFTNYDFMYSVLMLLKITIQVGIIALLFAGLLFQRRDVTSTPHAAHNRSINWFQSLQNLPPLQRARELEKWESFTKDLPTDKSLSVSLRSDDYRF
jgi:hypothetical protein